MSLDDTARRQQLCTRLLDLAIEVQAHGNRLHAAGGKCLDQSKAVIGAAWALAAAARKLVADSGEHETINLFFPPRDNKAPKGAPEDDDSTEDEHGIK